MANQTYTMKYSGTGIGVLWRAIVGALLMMITLGLYTPWFITWMTRFVCDNVSVENLPAGSSTVVEFRGSGGGLFGRFILWYIALIFTLGFFWPWMMNGMYRFIVENIEVRTA